LPLICLKIALSSKFFTLKTALRAFNLTATKCHKRVRDRQGRKGSLSHNVPVLGVWCEGNQSQTTIIDGSAAYRKGIYILDILTHNIAIK